MNPKKPLTSRGLPSGVCMKEPAAKKGSACDSNPCGLCGDVECVASDSNSWGYQCVPTATTIALMSKSNGKILNLQSVCRGRRRAKRCTWETTAADSVLGSTQYIKQKINVLGRGTCNANKTSEHENIRTVQECMKLGAKDGAKAISWRFRGGGRPRKQQCYTYKDYCKVIPGQNPRHLPNWGEERWFLTYMSSDRQQVWQVSKRKSGHSQLKSLLGGDICLAMGADGPFGATCNEQEKNQEWEINQNCKLEGTVKSMMTQTCIQTPKNTGDIYGSHACDSHYAEQLMSVIKVA